MMGTDKDKPLNTLCILFMKIKKNVEHYVPVIRLTIWDCGGKVTHYSWPPETNSLEGKRE